MSTISESQIDRIHESWPESGLETVTNCPVCASTNRETLHDGLRDWVFYAAPGKWKLFKCLGCGVGYLDPRPNDETIHLAYETYYTHNLEKHSPRASIARQIQDRLANGYRNWHFGTTDRPASSLGLLAAALWPNGRAQLDTGMRHLPKSKKGQRLLDLGCGNGAFLRKAMSAGWDVVGVDPDDAAVKEARKLGLNVLHGDVDVLHGMDDYFDVITMSHVIEHLHDPVSVLERCFSLLKPGGKLWLETPNVEALGHSRFGAFWRGLEPPRHLVLFSSQSLHAVLENIGYEAVEVLPCRNVAASTYRSSYALSQGMDPYIPLRLPDEIEFAIRADSTKQIRDEGCREFLTLRAAKALSPLPMDVGTITA